MNDIVPFFQTLTADAAPANPKHDLNIRGGFRGGWIERCDRAVILRVGSIATVIPAGARGGIWWGTPQDGVSIEEIPSTNTVSAAFSAAPYICSGWFSDTQRPLASPAIELPDIDYARYSRSINDAQRVQLVSKADAPYGEAGSWADYEMAIADDRQRVRFQAQTTIFSTGVVPFTVGVQCNAAPWARCLGYMGKRVGGRNQQLRLRRAWVHLHSATAVTDIAVSLYRFNGVPHAGAASPSIGFTHDTTFGVGTELATPGAFGDGLPRALDLQSVQIPAIAQAPGVTRDRMYTVPINTGTLTGNGTRIDLWNDDLPDGEGAINNGAANFAETELYGQYFGIVIESNAVIVTVQALGGLTIS